MKMRFALLLLAAALCAGCSSGFQPLKAKPVVATRNRPLPPENPVYGVPSYEAPMVWVAEDPDDVKGSTRNVEPRPEPAREILAQAMVAEEIGDTETLLARLHEAADAGNARAHYELARHYLTGEGVPADQAAALDHLSQADALGSAEASRVLAWNYLRGTGVQQDVEYGTRLMEKAARTSDRALREISLLYLNTCEPYLNDPQRGRPCSGSQRRRRQRLRPALPARPAPAAGPADRNLGGPGPRTAAVPGAEHRRTGRARRHCHRPERRARRERGRRRSHQARRPLRRPRRHGALRRETAQRRVPLHPAGAGVVHLVRRRRQPWQRPAAERIASLAPILQNAEQQQPGLVGSMIAALDSAIQPPRQQVQ